MSDQQASTAGVRCPACTIPLPMATVDCPHCALVQPARLADLLERVDRVATTAVTLRADAQAYVQALRTHRPAPAPVQPAPVRPAWVAPVQPAPSPVRPAPVRPAATVGMAPGPAPARLPAAMPSRGATPPQQLVGRDEAAPPWVVVRHRWRLSPQATLLALGVLLLLAAGVTFLAVNWSSLSLGLQASIMGTLAAAALAGAVPASRQKLAGTAEALALLGFGLLVVDLYGARAKGLIPPDATDNTTYAGLACAGLALVCLMMHRIAPGIVTFGLATVLVAQVPVTLLLITRGDLAVLLAALLAQSVATLLWTRPHGSRPVRVAGATCALLAFAAVTQIALVRILLGLPPDPPVSLSAAVSTGVVAVLAAATGIWTVRRNWLPFATPPAVGECACTAVGALAIGGVLAQLPHGGTWLVTGLATVVVVVELLRTPGSHQGLPRGEEPDQVLSPVLLTAAVMLGGFDVIVLAAWTDLRQLACVALISGALAVLANIRGRIDATAMAAMAFTAPSAAIVLLVVDGLIDPWSAGIASAVIAAASIGFAGWRVGNREEGAALVPGALAATVGVVVMLVGTTGTDTATGIGLVLTIAAAPLLGYGHLPGRKAALLLAVPLLTAANIGFVLGARADTLELFTVPPALVMLAAGLIGWRSRSSWISIAPGLLVGLLPSALIATRSEEPVRLAAVVAVALAVILIGVAKSLQAPFVIGTVVLAKIGIWQFLTVAPLIPRWITLGLAGAILLAVGATYERRLAQARQAIRWVGDLR